MADHQHHQQDRGDRENHHRGDHGGLRIEIVTVSDTRTQKTDESGRIVRELLECAGHHVADHSIVADSAELIRGVVEGAISRVDVVILTGGTGIAPRDVTIEAIRPLLDREIEGFGELFRMLSFNEIGAAAFLSRALAGVVGGKILVALPGSPAACRLGLEKLLLPELGHVASLLGL